MNHHPPPFIRTVALFIASTCVCVLAGDWPQWGHDGSRNMVSAEKNLPSAGKKGDAPEGDHLQPNPSTGVKWVVKLGSQTYGNPTVAGSKVFVGTNNDSPRDPKV